MGQECFNQKYTSLIAITPTGYRLFNLEEIDTTLKVRQICEKKSIRLIDGLWDESICAMVMESNPTQLILWDLIRKAEKSNYNYPSPILSVKLSRKSIVVFCETRILIHNIKDIKNNVKTHNIPSNPERIWDFANRSEQFAYVVYKHYDDEKDKKIGKIQIFDTKSVSPQLNMGKVVNTYIIDDKPLAALAFSHTGTEIATVNTFGTVIKICATKCGARLMIVRRGHTGALISSLFFSTCGKYLVSASNKKTVHVYHVKLHDKNEPVTLGKTIRSMLPTFLCQDRAFATASLPIAGSGRAFGIANLQDTLRLMVCTSDGALLVYSIPIASGQTCDVIKRFNLQEDSLEMTVELPPSRFCTDYDDDTPSTSAAALRMHQQSAATISSTVAHKTIYEEAELFSL